MRVTGKYKGNDPSFTRGATYHFDVKQHVLGKKISAVNMERRSANQKAGYDLEFVDIVDFLITFQIDKMQLTAHETNMIALRDEHFGHNWGNRL